MACLTPIYSNCIVFTADLRNKLSALGYTSTNLEEFIFEIISKSGSSLSTQVAALKQSVDNLSTGTIKADSRTFGLGTGSVEVTKLTNRKVNYSVSDRDFTFDFNDLKADLPTDFRVLGGRVELIDSNGKKSSARGTGSTVKAVSVPFTAKVELTIQTPSGQMELERELLISGDTASSATLNPRNLSAASDDLYQRDFNELIAAEIVALKQKL